MLILLPNSVGEVSPSYGDGGVMGWERATPVALFLSIIHPMSATGVARSQRRVMTLPPRMTYDPPNPNSWAISSYERFRFSKSKQIVTAMISSTW